MEHETETSFVVGRLSSFPAADLLTATRLMGRVVLPGSVTTSGHPNQPECSPGTTRFDDDTVTTDADQLPEPEPDSQLQSILCIDTCYHSSDGSKSERQHHQQQQNSSKQYFWLQRKIRTTPLHGAVRVGFVLDPPSPSQEQYGEDKVVSSWKVAVVPEEKGGSAEGQPQVQMVAIRVEPRARVFPNDDDNNKHSIRTLQLANELAVLQWVARHGDSNNTRAPAVPEYVQGPSVLLAADAEYIYTIVPYDYYHTGSCTLFDYCATQPGGRLPEETARSLFQQIVKVL